MNSYSAGKEVKPNAKKALAPTPSAPERLPTAEYGTDWHGWRLAAPVFAGVLASILLLWGLTEKYLWQDEANTAVLAARMLRFGRPLAYDGVNLLTIDRLSRRDAAEIDQRTTDPKAAIDYYVDRGYLKADTAWTFHPWGQFLVAAASFKILGQTTLAARLPFALAGLATILLLYRLVRVYCRSGSMALIAALLLICNSFWILHSRQSRYYSLSSLLLVLTLIAYMHWQSGGRLGAPAFVTSAWVWFQVDYGTVWPVLAVLAIDTSLAHRRNLWRPAWAWVALSVTIAPFTIYYGLWRRGSSPRGAPGASNYRYWFNLLNMNEYVVPLLVVTAAAALLVWRWKTISAAERRLVAIGIGIICALSIWVPLITSGIFLRYIIMAAPVGCLLSSWLLVRGCNGRPAYAWLGTAVLILTPWLSMPLQVLNPQASWYSTNKAATNWTYKGELVTLFNEVFNPPADPNRIVIEWLSQNAAPTDEILTNYEDIPLMFYLPNPVRGGIAAFRVEDDAKRPPSFLVLRRSVNFVHWEAFVREANRYQWTRVPTSAPDVAWGNNPDPIGVAQDFVTKEKIIVARRVKDGGEAISGKIQE